MDLSLWIPAVIYGFSVSGIFFLVSLGLSIGFGLMRVVNLEQMLYYTFSAYMTYTMVALTGKFWLGLVCGVLLAGFIGFLVETQLLRRVGGVWTGTFEIPNPGSYTVAYMCIDSVGNVSELVTSEYMMATIDVDLALNGSTFGVGDTVQVSVGYTNNIGDSVDVDFYLVVTLPNGVMVFINGMFGPTLETGTPYWSGLLPPGDMGLTPLYQLTVTDGLEYGNYEWFAAFTEPGTLNFMGDVANVTMVVEP